MTGIVHPPIEEPGNVRPGYYMAAADANTQTTDEDFILLEPTRDASTQTTYEDFILLEPTRDASTQTTEEDFFLLEPTRDASTQTTDEDFILLEPTRDASIQTTDEDFTLLKPTGDVSIQTTNEDFNLLEPIRDASTQMAKEDFILLEPTRDAGTRTMDEDVIVFELIRDEITQSSEGYLSSIESTENNSISASETSADTSETMFIALHSYDNGCCIVNSHLSNFSSALEVPRHFDIANGCRNQQIQNDMRIAKKIHVRNKKINTSNRQGIRYNSRVRNLSRNKISGTSGQVILTNSGQSGMCYGFTLVSQMDFDNNCLTGVPQESQKSIQGNRGMQKLGILSRNGLLDIGQNAAPNIFQTAEIGNIPRKISDSRSSDAESIHSVVDISAVPGTSGYHENKKTPNLCGEKFPSRFPLMKSVLSKKKKRPICWICNTEYAEHVVGKNFYKCCVCRYVSYTKRELHMHTCIHGPEPFSCKICGEGFTEKGSHGSEQTCYVCWKEFQCKALLEKHSLAHEGYYLTHCRVCRWKINAHIIEYGEQKLYRCCSCFYRTHHKNYLQQHLHTHSGLRLFRCDVCGRRFTEKGNLERHYQNHIM